MDIPGQIKDDYPELLKKNKICISPALGHLPWNLKDNVMIGSNDGSALVGIGQANAGIAQTGALVFANHLKNPASIGFLSEDHFIILNESHIKETMSEVIDTDWKFNAVNLIAGPSSTADIAGKMLVGVHGPARVCCYIVKK